MPIHNSHQDFLLRSHQRQPEWADRNTKCLVVELMAVTTPAPRIGKTIGVRPRPANSEKRPVNAAWHATSEIAANGPARKKAKRKGMTGLINRAG